jgi:hypothetical protein
MLIEGVVKLIAAIETFEVILAIAKMNVNYLMMILPKGIHIEFRNMNHPDNMDIEGIDNRHILDDRQGVAEHIVGVAEHIAGVAEHIVGVAEHIAGVAEHIAGVAEHIVGVAEHIVGVAEHMAGVAEHMAGVAEHMAVASAEAEAAAAAAVADIDNKHIQDVNDANAVDSVEGNRQQGILQKHSH